MGYVGSCDRGGDDVDACIWGGGISCMGGCGMVFEGLLK